MSFDRIKYHKGRYHKTVNRCLLIPSMLLCFMLTGCGPLSGTSAAQEADPAQEAAVTENASAAVQERPNAGNALDRTLETAIDFPFPYNAEGYTLTLLTPEGGKGDSQLKLCDAAGQAVQQFPCGEIAQPARFSFDRLANRYYADLVIFPSGGQTGLLFAWNGERFSEKAIPVPLYDEARLGFMVSETDGACQEKRIYEVNVEKGKTEERRIFHSNAGAIRILKMAAEIKQSVLYDFSGKALFHKILLPLDSFFQR